MPHISVWNSSFFSQYFNHDSVTSPLSSVWPVSQQCARSLVSILPPACVHIYVPGVSWWAMNLSLALVASTSVLVGHCPRPSGRIYTVTEKCLALVSTRVHEDGASVEQPGCNRCESRRLYDFAPCSGDLWGKPLQTSWKGFSTAQQWFLDCGSCFIPQNLLTITHQKIWAKSIRLQRDIFVFSSWLSDLHLFSFSSLSKMCHSRTLALGQRSVSQGVVGSKCYQEVPGGPEWKEDSFILPIIPSKCNTMTKCLTILDMAPVHFMQ